MKGLKKTVLEKEEQRKQRSVDAKTDIQTWIYNELFSFFYIHTKYLEQYRISNHTGIIGDRNY